MTTQIPPNQMGTDVRNRLINSLQNPSGCPCGWYVYYSAVCTHAYQEVKYECGNKTTPSGRSGFCKTPAPKNIVQGVQINVKCQYC
ncbi:uncharacterized protein N7511_011398 [Penicillium nucicola]|uniref:uncharacterized protein n=1 Tax=Penicillium nucicola TaxID=1850975 RepID=UPI002545AF50|nr:uncharacterized protein N7511_011398 [Penicillium nucicola]KAJ5742379.1 hypothetical protein N7511_011398 [Penicillium nucicola]